VFDAYGGSWHSKVTAALESWLCHVQRDTDVQGEAAVVQVIRRLAWIREGYLSVNLHSCPTQDGSDSGEINRGQEVYSERYSSAGNSPQLRSGSSLE
jgi:hypothetical protein